MGVRSRTPTLLLIAWLTSTSQRPSTKRHPRRRPPVVPTCTRAKLGLTLAPPLAVAIGVIYLGSLALLLVNAFWKVDVLTA